MKHVDCEECDGTGRYKRMNDIKTDQNATSEGMGARLCSAINIIFDGPPGPVAGRFVEVETDDGKSINAGEWAERTDGLWALRIAQLPNNSAICVKTRSESLMNVERKGKERNTMKDVLDLCRLNLMEEHIAGSPAVDRDATMKAIDLKRSQIMVNMEPSSFAPGAMERHLADNTADDGVYPWTKSPLHSCGSAVKRYAKPEAKIFVPNMLTVSGGPEEDHDK